MPAPWDVAPIPEQGDRDATDIYAAKGRAVSMWEVMEVSLSRLYAIFTGQPRFSRAAYQQYGEPLSFKARLDGLQRVAGSYFVGKPNQEGEAEFEDLVERARQFAMRRNEITHSWVQPVAFDRQHETLSDGSHRWTTTYWFFLVPPLYTSRKFDPNERPEFMYTSREIDMYAGHFADLEVDAVRLAVVLEHPQLRSLL